MLDPRRLLTFRAVAREGSFSRAATALHRSQPAVSHQIAALERELGAALLVRGRGGATPTPAGELLLAHADALAARLELAGTQMDALAAETRRGLRVGGFPSSLATIVPAAAAALREREPDLELAVEEGTVPELEEAVRAGRLDAAIGWQDTAAPRHEPEGLRRVDLHEEPMDAVLRAGHGLARRRRIALADLAGETWMAPERDGLLVRACRAAGFEPRIAIVTRDPLAARALGAAGLAVSLTPRLLAAIPLPGQVTVALSEPAPRRGLYAVVPPAGAHPLAAALVDHLRRWRASTRWSSASGSPASSPARPTAYTRR